MSLSFRTTWIDPRLAYNNSLSEEKYLDVIDWIYHYYIWKPDIVFSDAKSAEVPKTPNFAKMLRIYKDGRVFISSKIIAKIYCTMDWSKFPMDIQKCPIRLSTCKYTTTEIRGIIIWG